MVWMYKLPFRDEQGELENEGRGLKLSWTTAYYTSGLKKESRVQQIKRVKGLRGSFTFFSLPCLFNIVSPEGKQSPLTSPTEPAFSCCSCQICCWPPCPQLSGWDWLRTSNGPQRCCFSLVCSNIPQVERRDEAPFNSRSLDQSKLQASFFCRSFHLRVMVKYFDTPSRLLPTITLFNWLSGYTGACA